MKLGKKDKSSSAAAPASKKGGTSLFLLIALLGALLGAVAATLYLQKSLVEPANAKHQETLNATRAAHAAALVAYGVKQVEGELQGLAGLTKVREALSDPTEKARLETELARMLPHADRVVLSPVGQARADSGAAVPLRFAGLDLIRRVQAGQPPSAEGCLGTASGCVAQAWPDPTEKARLESELARMLPHAERVVLSPVGQARADSGAAVPLSFAGLDLIRRVEAGQPQSAEAFLSNNRWFVQMAWPVKNQA